MRHLIQRELTAGLEKILETPKDKGTLELIVRRPGTAQREILEEGQLDPD